MFWRDSVDYEDTVGTHALRLFDQGVAGAPWFDIGDM